MRRLAQLSCLAALGLLLVPAEAGHELPIYPSYYPQEIRVEVVDPAAAAERLRDARIHAYVGAEPAPGAPVPDTVGHVQSLGAYLVLTFPPESLRPGEGPARCAAAARLARTLAEPPAPLVFHPYPITPYHADYLHHLDLAEASRRSSLGAAPGPAVKVRAEGPLAERLFGPPGPGTGWQATAGTVPVADLGAAPAAALNGWLGPPWAKAGWFHALALLGPALSDPDARAAVASMADRLRRGEHGTPEERLNLERDLVTRLRRGCERVVLGYTVRREYFNVEFSAGIENVGYDSQTGLNSLLFLRTAKLKDFPWNGWLRIGIGTPPAAAWNPVGGFTDPAGRLIWQAVGDPAALPAPYGDGWVLNRVADVRREPAR